MDFEGLVRVVSSLGAAARVEGKTLTAVSKDGSVKVTLAAVPGGYELEVVRKGKSVKNRVPKLPGAAIGLRDAVLDALGLEIVESPEAKLRHLEDTQEI